MGFIFTGLAVMGYLHLRDELVRQELKVEQIKKEKQELQGVLTQLQSITEDQNERLQKAFDERKKYLEKLSKDINSLRKQPIPKDCQGAVDFAIKNKEDLKW